MDGLKHGTRKNMDGSAIAEKLITINVYLSFMSSILFGIRENSIWP